MVKMGYCAEKKGRRYSKSRSESELIGIRLSASDNLIDDDGRGKQQTPGSNPKSAKEPSIIQDDSILPTGAPQLQTQEKRISESSVARPSSFINDTSKALMGTKQKSESILKTPPKTMTKNLSEPVEPLRTKTSKGKVSFHDTTKSKRQAEMIAIPEGSGEDFT
jgi:hypothetical protein